MEKILLMGNVAEKSEKIRTVGRSWVIRLPKSFTSRNKLEPGTQVVLTVKNGESVDADILPPISSKLSSVATGIMKKRRAVYEELKRLGD
jgi:antitoxin component of MazEF toxin-antitoxin module